MVSCHVRSFFTSGYFDNINTLFDVTIISYWVYYDSFNMWLNLMNNVFQPFFSKNISVNKIKFLWFVVFFC